MENTFQQYSISHDRFTGDHLAKSERRDIHS